MTDPSPTVIRIYKKRGHGHEGHHGGAWKVAYADFVTAMMAFFLVMWLVSMDQEVKDAVEGYFNNPIGFKRAYSSGEDATLTGISGAMAIMTIGGNQAEREQLETVAGKLERHFGDGPGAPGAEGRVDIALDGDGLRIELIEAGAEQTFFELGSSLPRATALSALRVIAGELETVPNRIVLEGHTDARPLGRALYSNWELSSDRAHAARRALERFGIQPGRFAEVRGYADRRLRVPHDPLDGSNRRISILLPFLSEPDSVGRSGGGRPQPVGDG